MSSTSKTGLDINADLEDQDESVRIAVRALGDMRSGVGSASNSVSSSGNGMKLVAQLPYDCDDVSPSSPSPNAPNPAQGGSTLASPSRRASTSTTISITTASGSSASTSTTTGGVKESGGLISRMSHIPLVNSAMRAYEHGKASSRVVKYGAEMVESSVKSISRPVIDRLPVNVDRLDEFACRQLDRLDRYRRPSTDTVPPITATTPPSYTQELTPTTNAKPPRLKTKTLDGTPTPELEDPPNITPKREDEEEEGSDKDVEMDIEGSTKITTRQWVMRAPGPGRISELVGRGDVSIGKGRVPSWLESTSPFVVPPVPSEDSRSLESGQSRSSTPTQSNANGSIAANGGTERQVAQRSRWQAVLLEAGGLSAALSEESMKRLKYCLQWLQYATAHIDAQILTLRDFTASLQPLPSSNPNAASQRRPPISPEQLRKLTAVRRDLVHTIRQVVDVVSKYAGASLPEPARKRVRGFILGLPQKWASVAKANGGDGSLGISLSEDRSSLGGDRGESSATVAAAGGTGTGAVRRQGMGGVGQRRAAHRERGVDSGYRSGPSSRATSPARGGPGSTSTVNSPRVSRTTLDRGERLDEGAGGDGSGQHVSASTAMVAAQRILALATESLDMMRGVTGVVKDSLDRAEAWVGRLRTVGIQRGDGTATAEDGFPPPDFGMQDTAEERFTQYRSNSNVGNVYTHGKGHSRTESSNTSSTNFDDFDRERELKWRSDKEPESPPPPFYGGSIYGGSTASSSWASSIPSTPGGSSGNPGPMYVQAYNGSSPAGSNGVSNGGGSGPHSNYGSPRVPQSPLAIPLSAMSISNSNSRSTTSGTGTGTSRYGTPKSGIVGLLEEEEVEVVNVDLDPLSMDELLKTKDHEFLKRGDVKIVHEGEGIEGGEVKMDIDSVGA